MKTLYPFIKDGDKKLMVLIIVNRLNSSSTDSEKYRNKI
jgi:hypothetical protein